MRHPRARTAPVVAAALLFLASCSDAPVTSPELESAEARPVLEGMGERELLLAVLARLDAIESRFERERAHVLARFDSVVADGVVRLAGAPPPENPGGGGGGGGMQAHVDSLVRRLSTLDSIMNLASFIAEDVARPFQGIEVCGKLDVNGQADLKTHTAGDIRGRGGVGVDFGTGAFAQVGLGTVLAVEFGAGAEAGVGIEACWDLTDIGSDPRVTARPASGATPAPPSAQLEAAIMNARSRLGFNEQSLERALTASTDVLQSGDLTRLGDLASSLPVPAPLRDPVGTIRSRISTLDPVPMLCGGGFGGRLTSVVAEGCSIIQSGDLPELRPFAQLGTNVGTLTDRVSDLVDGISGLGGDLSSLRDQFSALDGDFSGLRGDFTTLRGRFDPLCSRFNDVLNRRLRVDVDMPWGNDQVLDVRLFPAIWTVQC